MHRPHTTVQANNPPPSPLLLFLKRIISPVTLYGVPSWKWRKSLRLKFIPLTQLSNTVNVMITKYLLPCSLSLYKVQCPHYYAPRSCPGPSLHPHKILTGKKIITTNKQKNKQKTLTYVSPKISNLPLPPPPPPTSVRPPVAIPSL